MEIQPRDIVWRAGGRSLLRHGTLTARTQIPARGGEDAKETFTRADATTSATTFQRDKNYGVVLANVPRLDWIDADGDGILETATWLFEGAGTNTALRWDALDNATWTKVRSSITPDATASPFAGTTTADKLVEDATASATHYAHQTFTMTSGEFIAASCLAKAVERSAIRLTVANTGATNGFLASFNLAIGAVASSSVIGAGVVSGSSIRAVGLGFYRCNVWGAVNGGVTTGDLFAALENPVGTQSYTGNGTSGLYVTGVGIERNGSVPLPPSSPIATAASTVTRAAEYATWPLALYPGQDMTLYLEVYLRSLDTTVDRILCQLGATDTSTANLVIKLSSGNIVAIYTTAAGTSTGTLALGSPTLPGILEFRVTLAATGAVTLGYASAGGAESTNTGGALTPAPWATPKIMVGGRTTTLGAFMGLVDAFLVRGVATMTDCRQVPG